MAQFRYGTNMSDAVYFFLSIGFVWICSFRNYWNLKYHVNQCWFTRVRTGMKWYYNDVQSGFM